MKFIKVTDRRQVEHFINIRNIISFNGDAQGSTIVAVDRNPYVVINTPQQIMDKIEAEVEGLPDIDFI
jgi:hypothetical protein